MQTLICPVSSQRINAQTARLTGLLVAALIALYAGTGSITWMLMLAIDFGIRAFTRLRASPLSWLAARLVQVLRLTEVPIAKAPKIFAARVGLLFTLATIALFYIQPTASLVVALILMGFALLEAVGNVCVGCLVYTYLIAPLFRGDSTHDAPDGG